MTQMNKVMDPQKTAAMMREFEKESAKMDMTGEMSENLILLFRKEVRERRGGETSSCGGGEREGRERCRRERGQSRGGIEKEQALFSRVTN